MQVYIGQTRADGSKGGHDLISELAGLGYGECTQRDELPPRRRPWFLDNGAYKDWIAGEPFDTWEFVDAIQWIQRSEDKPDFIVVPDVVANGEESFAFSMYWGPILFGVAPLYVAIQDGMTDEHFDAFAGCFWVAGFFIGGTLEWKKANMRRIADFAHSVGRPCHLARCASLGRLRAAKLNRIDSVDTCQVLRRTSELDRFVRGINLPVFPSMVARDEAVP